MFMDERNEFSDGQTCANAASTVLSTNVIDSSVARDLGNGQPVYLVIQIDTTVTSDGAALIQFRLRSDAAAAIHATTSTAHVDTGAIPKATLVAGYTQVIPLPMGTTYERYIGVQHIVSAATTTAGTYSAFLTLDPTGWTAYADATN
tara:strand:- start:1216 stop:1656 length:441 start_codon:yes stop_codon:yes gene_type:complete